MTKFMRSIYDDVIVTQKRKKRHVNFAFSSLILSDELGSIISIPNQDIRSNFYYFNYNSSLQHLARVELVFLIKQITNSPRIHIKFNETTVLLKQSFQIENNWLKIDLTQYIHFFPVRFQLHFHEVPLQSTRSFLALYYRRQSLSKSRSRRNLPSPSQDELVTNPKNPSACQVRPFRMSFVDLNLTSWIVGPSSYEMNICSGTCQASGNMPSYFQMQYLLREIHPKMSPTLCCKPKRFTSTILLYYDGPNLILKRHENMRVVECGCS
ncbi:unnamed protein product [Adineta ricciae]|nr:unnamed protein product [Adineta ricciae]